MIAAVQARRVLTSCLPFLGAVLAIAAILSQEMQAGALVRYSLYLVLAVALPGVFTWRMLLRGSHTGEEPPTWLEDLSLGTIFGFAVQLPFYLLGVWLGIPLLVLVLPALVLVLSVTRLGLGVWTLPTDRWDVRASWVLAAVSVFGVAQIENTLARLWPLSMSDNKTLTPDATFHRALIGELSHHFPPQIPYLFDTSLDYHWFVHAQLAASRWHTGLDPLVLQRLVLPTVALGLTVAGLAAVALRLTGRPVSAVVAPTLLVAGAFYLMGPDHDAGFVTEPIIARRYISSPSHSYGVMMSIPAVMLILEVLKPNRAVPRATWLALALALFAVAGSKATFLPIFLCGAIAACFVQLLRHRRFDSVAASLAGLIVVVFLFAQIAVFGGQTGDMEYNPFVAARSGLRQLGIDRSDYSVVVMVLALLVGWLLYGVGVLGLVRDRRWLDPRAVWMLVSVTAGITAAFVFHRSGLSQLWFQRAIAEIVVLLSAWGLAYLLPKPLTGRAALALSGVAVSAGLLGFGASFYLDAPGEQPGHEPLLPVVLTVLTPVAILGVALALVVLLRLLRRKAAPTVAVAVVFLMGLSLTEPFMFAQRLLSGPVTSDTGGNLFAPGGIAAATYVKEHSSPEEVLATNVHCREPDTRRCDIRNFWVAAYAERRVVIEGWGYTATARKEVPGRPDALPAPIPELLATNDAAFEQPSPQTVGRMVREYDVSWFFVSKEYPADEDGLAALADTLSKEYENRNYVVYEVVSEAGTTSRSPAQRQ